MRINTSTTMKALQLVDIKFQAMDPNCAFWSPDTPAEMREILKHSNAPWVQDGQHFHMGNPHAACLEFFDNRGRGEWSLCDGRVQLYKGLLWEVGRKGSASAISGEATCMPEVLKFARNTEQVVMVWDLFWLFFGHIDHTMPTTTPTLDLPQWLR